MVSAVPAGWTVQKSGYVRVASCRGRRSGRSKSVRLLSRRLRLSVSCGPWGGTSRWTSTAAVTKPQRAASSVNLNTLDVPEPFCWTDPLNERSGQFSVVGGTPDFLLPVGDPSRTTLVASGTTCEVEAGGERGGRFRGRAEVQEGRT